jgi:hypothetical protein
MLDNILIDPIISRIENDDWTSFCLQGTVTFQLKLTCGEDYPARPPSVDWMDCPLELKVLFLVSLVLSHRENVFS